MTRCKGFVEFCGITGGLLLFSCRHHPSWCFSNDEMSFVCHLFTFIKSSSCLTPTLYTSGSSLSPFTHSPGDYLWSVAIPFVQWFAYLASEEISGRKKDLFSSFLFCTSRSHAASYLSSYLTYLDTVMMLNVELSFLFRSMWEFGFSSFAKKEAPGREEETVAVTHLQAWINILHAITGYDRVSLFHVTWIVYRGSCTSCCHRLFWDLSLRGVYVCNRKWSDDIGGFAFPEEKKAGRYLSFFVSLPPPSLCVCVCVSSFLMGISFGLAQRYGWRKSIMKIFREYLELFQKRSEICFIFLEVWLRLTL